MKNSFKYIVILGIFVILIVTGINLSVSSEANAQATANSIAISKAVAMSNAVSVSQATAINNTYFIDRTRSDLVWKTVILPVYSCVSRFLGMCSEYESNIPDYLSVYKLKPLPWMQKWVIIKQYPRKYETRIAISYFDK